MTRRCTGPLAAKQAHTVSLSLLNLIDLWRLRWHAGNYFTGQRKLKMERRNHTLTSLSWPEKKQFKSLQQHLCSRFQC